MNLIKYRAPTGVLLDRERWVIFSRACTRERWPHGPIQIPDSFFNDATGIIQVDRACVTCILCTNYEISREKSFMELGNKFWSTGWRCTICLIPEHLPNFILKLLSFWNNYTLNANTAISKRIHYIICDKLKWNWPGRLFGGCICYVHLACASLLANRCSKGFNTGIFKL